MAYVNDAQTLADIVSPAAAAAQMGIQNDQANYADQIKNTVAAGQAPAEIARPGLQNLFTQSQTANENAVGQQNQQSADIGKATMGSTIAAKNAGNQAAITQDQAKSLQTFGTMAGQVAGMMDQVPAAARPAAFAQVAQKYGIDLNSIPQSLQSGDPDALRSVSQSAVQMSSAYQEQQLKGQQEYGKATDVATIGANSRTQVAYTNADARQYVADRQAQVKQQLQKTDNIVASLMQKQAAGTLTPAEATTLNQAREAQAVARSNPFINNLINPDSAGSSNGAPVATPSAQPSSGGSAPAVSNPGPAIQKAVEASGESYNPDKFNYRVGPDGSIQRKPK